MIVETYYFVVVLLNASAENDTVNRFPNVKIFVRSKLKQIADDILKCI